jgi:adenylate cyclase
MASWQDELRSWLTALDNSQPMVAIARKVRRRLPGDPGFGDPLSTSGSSAGSVARLVQSVLDEQRPASREWVLGGLQMWQSTLERLGRGTGDRPVTIAFTDLVGFSSWALIAGDDETLALLRAVSGVFEPCVHEHGGNVVKRTGDGLMAVFTDPLSALEAMVQGREAVNEIQAPEYTPILRIGIHSGTPRLIGDDWLGVDVNVAARLMQHVGAGRIGISGPALDQIPPQRLEELGLAARRTRRILPERMPGVPSELPTYILAPPAPYRPSALLAAWLASGVRSADKK